MNDEIGSGTSSHYGFAAFAHFALLSNDGIIKRNLNFVKCNFFFLLNRNVWGMNFEIISNELLSTIFFGLKMKNNIIFKIQYEQFHS